MLRFTFVLSIVVSGCVAHDAVGVCAREGDWLMTFTAAPGSDPGCDQLEAEHVGVTQEQIYVRECSAGCTCTTSPGAVCAGTLTEACNGGSTNTALTCSYDLGFESGSGECTVAVSGDVTLSCRYTYQIRYLGPNL